MSQFRSGRERHQASGGSGTQQQQAINHILREDSGFTLVDSYIPKEKMDTGGTAFRILPSFDPESGVEDLALNPDYVFEDDPRRNDRNASVAPPDVVGRWACPIEMIYKAGFPSLTCITDTWTCRDGSVINDNWSLARVFMKNLRNKLKEAEEEITAQGPHGTHLVQSVPQAWIPWVGRWKDGYWQSWWKARAAFPFEGVLLQCMFREIAGDPIIDSASGQPKWLERAVLMMPRGVIPGFFTELKKRHDKTKPLTPANSELGDPVTCAGGYITTLKKVPRTSDASAQGVIYQMQPTLRDDSRMPLDPAEAHQRWVPWENIVHQPMVEDVMEDLANTFTWQAVAFALQGSAYQSLVPEQHIESARAIPSVGAAAPAAPTQSTPEPNWQQQAPAAAPIAPPAAPMAPPPPPMAPPPAETSFNLDNAGIASGSLGTDMPGIPAEAPPPGGTSDARINLPPGVAGAQDLMDRYRAGLSELSDD